MPITKRTKVTTPPINNKNKKTTSIFGRQTNNSASARISTLPTVLRSRTPTPTPSVIPTVTSSTLKPISQLAPIPIPSVPSPSEAVINVDITPIVPPMVHVSTSPSDPSPPVLSETTSMSPTQDDEDEYSEEEEEILSHNNINNNNNNNN